MNSVDYDIKTTYNTYPSGSWGYCLRLGAQPNYHRLDGPAYYDAFMKSTEWWVNGVFIMRESPGHPYSTKDFLMYLKAVRDFKKGIL